MVKIILRKKESNGKKMNEPTIVTLDSMIFIYLFEEDPRYLKYVKPLFEKIEKGSIHANTSIITLLEVLSSSKLEKYPDKTLVFRRFFQKTPHLSVFDVSWEIMETASQLRRNNSHFRTPDSVQLATAIVANSSFFVTNDKKLSGMKMESVKIVLVDEVDKLINI